LAKRASHTHQQGYVLHRRWRRHPSPRARTLPAGAAQVRALRLRSRHSTFLTPHPHHHSTTTPAGTS
jgi:hypothetical protein